LIGGAAEEIALTRNATVGMNYIAHGLDLKAGDEVVMTDQEHPGGRCGYDVRKKRDGVVIKEVLMPLPCDDAKAIVERFAAAISERTKVVAVPHMTSALGIVMPVAEIAALARAKGAFVVVDGAQSLGQIPVDVKKLGCDAFFSSPHKWLLAPKGSGLLWLARGSWAKVWTTIASSDWDLQTDAGRRLTQIGTGNQSLHKGFEAALDFLESIGHAAVHARIRQLGDALRAGLASTPGVKIVSPTRPELCAGMVTWKLEGHEHKQVAEELWQKDKIMPRAIGPGVRTSLHVYVTLDDVERLLRRLRVM
jgi:selenocysteine lyase/cysteine desulfurase